MPNIKESLPKYRKDALAALSTIGDEKSDIVFLQILWLSQNFGLVKIDDYYAVKKFWECNCKQDFVHYEPVSDECSKCGVTREDGLAAELQFVLAGMTKYLHIKGDK